MVCISVALWLEMPGRPSHPQTHPKNSHPGTKQKTVIRALNIQTHPEIVICTLNIQIQTYPENSHPRPKHTNSSRKQSSRTKHTDLSRKKVVRALNIKI